MSLTRSKTMAIGLCTVLWTGYSAGAAAQLADEVFEEAPQVRPSDILPRELLRSAQHSVLDEAEIAGGSYMFRIRSDFGFYEATSLAMLKIRVHEIRTLAQVISQFKNSNKKLADQLRGQLIVGADSFVEILASPFSTASSLASQFSTNVEQTVNELGEFPDPQSPQSQLVARDLDLMDPIADAYRRNIAHQMQVDVYSTNTKLQDFFSEVVRARLSGNFRAGVSVIRVPDFQDVGVKGGELDQQILLAIKNLSALDLQEAVSDQLKELGVSEDQRQEFLAHRSFSPRHRTVISAHLDFLNGVKGRAEFVSATLAATTEAQALSYARLSQMLAYYHENKHRLVEMTIIRGLPAAITRDHRLVFALPHDILYWTKQVQEIAEEVAVFAKAEGLKGQDVIVNGDLTYAARGGLERYGYQVYERFLDQ